MEELVFGIDGGGTKASLAAMDLQGRERFRLQGGAININGTGSICVGRDEQGNHARAGGMGHLIDDEGSGYAIGRDILRAVIRAQDGRSPQTSLTQAVFEALNVQSVQQLIAYVYLPGRPKKDIAALARLLPAHCALGDGAAWAIRDRAAEELVLLCAAVADRLALSQGELALSGSILQKNTDLQRVFRKKAEAVLPGFQIVTPRYDAACGAARMARRLVQK